jgi:magnesium-transporting ATPase (P-type)
MSTVSALPSGELIGAVKGAPETIKTMLSVVPENYDETYKWFTRRGSRVLALGFKQMRALPNAAVREMGPVPEHPIPPDLYTDQQTDA